jgi:hypothetical protein
MLTLQQLRTPVTEDQALETILEHLTSVGFNTTSWHVGALQRKFLRLFAIVYSDITLLIAALVDFVYNETATGAALTEFSASHYQNFRKLAVNTIGQMVLTNTGAVPHTVTDSQLVAAFTETDGTLRTYRNVGGGTVAAGGGTLTLAWVAETAGASWNIPVDSTLTLLTSLAGVAITNPLISGTDTWITTLGADEEDDPTLKERNRTKWPSLAIELIKDGVIGVALSASKSVTRVGVDDNNPRLAGTFDVYIAGKNATAGVDDVTAVQNKLKGRVFGSDTVRTYAAPTQFLDLTGTVYYDAGFTQIVVKTAVEAALTAFLATVPLGGFKYSAGPSNIVFKNNVEAIIKETLYAGQKPVKTVSLSVPTGDVAVGSFAVVVKGVWNLTYTPVTEL